MLIYIYSFPEIAVDGQRNLFKFPRVLMGTDLIESSLPHSSIFKLEIFLL